MLDALKFVQGAINKRDYVPALTHFCIKDGRVMGFNGKLSLSAPIDLDVACYPKASAFVAAVEACKDTIELHVTNQGKLSVRSGKFRALVEQIAPEEYPEVQPEGYMVEFKQPIIPALRKLYDLTCEDASRPWAASVLFDGALLMTTNNVVLIQYWIGNQFPYRVSIPRYAVRELVRIGEEPARVQVSGHSATFYYEGGRWLRTQLTAADWPDVESLFQKISEQDLQPIPEGFFEALETLMPFVGKENKVLMTPGLLSTADPKDEHGASVEVEGVECGLYNINMLLLLKDVATRVGFQYYPAPVYFRGDNLHGAIMGMR